MDPCPATEEGDAVSRGNPAVRNSLLFREVNERIREMPVSWLEDEAQELVCECRDADCIATIAVTRADFQAARERPGRFLLASHHAGEAGTRILAHWDGYVTVEFDESPG
jgi:hypothetical protein